jgi:hypothetical protein
MNYHGRKKPYTQIGICRVPCSRCGNPSYASWGSCANGNYYVAMCLDCDIAINRLVLKYMRIPNYKQLMKEYIKSKK